MRKRDYIYYYIIGILAVVVLVMGIGYYGSPITGYQMSYTEGNSMKPVINPCDIVIIDTNHTSIDNIHYPEIIAFEGDSNNKVVHRTNEKFTIQEPSIVVTKGFNNKNPDTDYTTQEEIIGKVVWKLETSKLVC